MARTPMRWPGVRVCVCLVAVCGGGAWAGPASGDAEAMDAARVMRPSSALGVHGGAREGCVGGADIGENGLLFDGGLPNQQNANEMTRWLQAEDFELTQASVVASIRFWTLEAAPTAWAGVCNYAIYEDDGGAPGAMLESGVLNLIGRTLTGNIVAGLAEIVYNFSFPAPVSLEAGVYWIGLHMHTGCTTIRSILWVTTSNNFGAVGHERFECLGAWEPNGNQHAFLLYGEAQPPGCPGDIDGDGSVDVVDLGRVLASFGLCSTDIGFDPDADLTLDGCVGEADLGVVLEHFGAACP